MRLISLLSIVLVLGVAHVSAAPKADLWPRWQTHDPASTLSVDHAPWTDFLQKNLILHQAEGVHKVRYGAVTPEDHQALKTYLGGLQQTAISRYSKAEQQAFWVNLYNAATVDLILDHYPVESIRDISFGLLSFGPFSLGPWNEPLLEVEGVALTLNDIEHRILRPIWRDPRLHYALNCASLGCPDLKQVAFSPENTAFLLDSSARSFINHPRGVRFEEGDLVLSTIYDWFDEDFGGSEEGVLAHLKQFANPELRKRLEEFDGDIEYDYDWNLNSTP